MNRRRIVPLVLGVVLLGLGVGLILYGSTLPADFVTSNRWYYYEGEVNLLMLIGLFPISIGISFLLFWFLTRSRCAVKS